MSLIRQPISYSEEEYEKRREEVDSKMANKLPLSEDDKYFLCSHVRFRELPKYSFCQDEYYTRMYFRLRMPHPHDTEELIERDVINYQGLVNEWKVEIDDKDHKNDLLRIISKETRKELSELNKTYSYTNPYNSIQDYQDKKNVIIEWSKYRYM